jgi:hypothetical protein
MDPLNHSLGVFLLSGRKGLMNLLDHFVGCVCWLVRAG